MKRVNKVTRPPITMWVSDKPYSFDPLEFDAFVHHVTQRPVFSTLVTQYKAGSFLGVLASTWETNSLHTQWTFHLRSGLTFANGDSITPSIVASSLRRIAWLQHSIGSHSGLTEHLVGIETLKTADGQIPGISVSGTDLILTFKDPQPKLLETISFGTYGVVSPIDYDPRTGAWRNAKSANSSGAYAPTAWSDEGLSLTLRPDFPATLRHPNPPQVYLIQWGKDQRSHTDLGVGGQIDAESFPDKELHTSGAVGISIYYVQAFSWKQKDSPVSDRSIRLCLRNEFYRALTAVYIEPMRSFLPPIIPGVTEGLDTSVPKTKKRFKIRAVRSPGGKGFRNHVMTAIEAAVNNCGGEFVASTVADFAALSKHYDPDAPSYDVDLYPLITGLLVEDPIGDVRFMVLSKEGIRLPDPTGRLATEVAKPNMNLGEINRIIWDDAIVWPVTHYSSGIWSKKDMFDFSLLNLNLPPTDLSWIGIKS